MSIIHIAYILSKCTGEQLFQILVHLNQWGEVISFTRWGLDKTLRTRKNKISLYRSLFSHKRADINNEIKIN